jgi:Raf kinase inhibitor-like YbhB/YbcL family protein
MAYPTTQVRAPQPPKSGTPLTVASETFSEGAAMPRETALGGCGGENRSPQLAWSGAPPETRSYAITCFDPDAPTGAGYWHWVLWNVPASVTRLALGESRPKGSTTGRNDYGASEYGGPCPPKGDGAHRYVFTVYALDVASLDGVDEGLTGASLLFTMRGHVLAQGSITGTFGH